MGQYTISFKVDKNTVALVYLSEIYHIDLTTLLLLYEKLSVDVFYFFYLFGGAHSGFPKSSKLLKIIKFGQSFCELRARGQPTTSLATSHQERKVLERLNSLFSPQSRLFVLPIEVVNKEEGIVPIGEQKPLREEIGIYSPR